jgi:hypothetical protein
MIKVGNFIKMAKHFESERAQTGYAAGDMDYWWSLDTIEMGIGDSMTAGELFNTCGSTVCIRALAVCLFRPERGLSVTHIGNDGQLAFHCAQSVDLDGELLLGLRSSQTNLLFDSTRWSKYWRNELDEAPNATMARVCRLIAQEQSVDFLEINDGAIPQVGGR